MEFDESRKDCGKIKAHSMNLTSTVSTRSSFVNRPIASRSPGVLKACTGKPDAMARRTEKPDAASSSQGRLKDAYLDGLDGCTGGATCRDRSKSRIIGIF